MRTNGKELELSLPAVEAGPSSMAAGAQFTAQPSLNNDISFSPSRKASLPAFKSDQMTGNFVSSSTPDYFASSIQGTESPAAASRPNFLSSSSHPWANLFPESGSGPTTSLPQSERIPSLHAPISMSASSSSPGLALKVPSSKQRTRSGASTYSVPSLGANLSGEELARYRPIKASDLAKVLSSSPQQGVDTLIIDIRPSTSYSLARIRDSVNLCAPSTLLKRPGVTVERIEEEMLQNERDQARFRGWKAGPRKNGVKSQPTEKDCTPIHRIVVVDTDTSNLGEAGKPSAGGGGPCLIGLLRKFDAAGFAGDLHWLLGGFSAFSSTIKSGEKTDGFASDKEILIDTSSPSRTEDKGPPALSKGILPGLRRTESQRRSSAPVHDSSLTDALATDSTVRRQQSLVQPGALPREAFSLISTTRRSSLGEARRELQGSSSHPTFDSSGRAAASDTTGSACANPFFDNIRQNRELQHGITERIPLELPPLSQEEVKALPDFCKLLVEMDDKQRADTLAKRFFEIEKAEQRRLTATMQQHAAESNLSGMQGIDRAEQMARHPSAKQDILQLSSSYAAVRAGQNCDNTSKETFPFSIAAALERGSENRYNNIWTYEHSRIRCADASQYLNGSFLEPAKQFGCQRRYIATQAPLPSTFGTFWTVIWQQNVRTICMVTREFECGRVQSHNYWKEDQYGGFQLKMVEEVTLDANGDAMAAQRSKDEVLADGGHLFPRMSNGQDSDGESAGQVVKRRFLLSDGSQQREVMQFQFVAWPDFSIPDDAQGILTFMRMANREQHRAEVEERSAGQQIGPLLVHCSAGVGRTGTYIVVDSVLAVLRHQRRQAIGMSQADLWDDDCYTLQATPLQRHPQEDIKMTSALTSLSHSQHPRKKSLKRELSPSAMEIDPSDGGYGGGHPATFFGANGAARQDASSPPPLRRGRSDETEDLPPLGLSALSSPKPMSSSSSGVETPSGAMSSMRIAWDVPQHTPTKSKSNQSSLSAMDRIPAVQSPTVFPPLLSSTFVPDSVKTPNADEPIDLIQQAVETIREQRMSTVQTTRQYVFAYRAVIEGVLSETREQKIAGPA